MKDLQNWLVKLDIQILSTLIQKATLLGTAKSLRKVRKGSHSLVASGYYLWFIQQC